MMKKKSGFTLAEVLITIAILGIVAAITLPAIKTNVDNVSLEKQTAKFYSQMKNGIDLFKAHNDTDNITGYGIGEDPDAFIKKYFNITGKCDKFEDCFASKYNLIDGGSFSPEFGAYGDSYRLVDGSVFNFEAPDDDYPISVYFDVNGKKGPNIAGRDLWVFKIYYDGSIDEEGLTPEERKKMSAAQLHSTVESKFEQCKKSSNNGYGTGCFGHFLRNGFKFDY